MILMCVFLVLTLVFIIGTAIYLDNKKKNDNREIKINKPQESNEQKNKNSKKKLADILNLKIYGNIISLGNRYSQVIRLGNIDYNMLSIREQDSIENILIQSALAIDDPIQFFSTTEFIDTSKAVALMKENKTKNYKIAEYKKYLIEYLESLMENRTISVVKNYAIISYDGTYENAVEELNRKVMSFKGSLLRATIVCDVLDEDDLYNLVYRELNKNSALNISNLKKGGRNLYVGKKQKTKTDRHI